MERAFEDAGNFEESPERSLLLERLAQLSELMGFRVEGLGNGQGNEGGDGDG